MIRLLLLSPLMASPSQPRPQELGGRGIGDISSTAFILCHKAAFYYHWHGDEGADR